MNPVSSKSTGRILVPLLLAGLCAGARAAQSTAEVKIPNTPRAVQPDLKTPAPPVVKTPATVDLEKAALARRPPGRAPEIDVPRGMTQVRPIDRNRVYTDASAGDGSIWARGATWKASFGEERTSFIPYFGACAPKAYPLSFSIAGVEAGGVAVGFDTRATPVLAGTRITFDRGGVVERYDLAPASIEQSFVFPSVPAGGDLVVRLAVECELVRSVESEGLRFANDLGRVRYGKATVLDAAGRSGPADAQLAGGAIELRVPAEFLATATFPVTIDPVVSVFDVDATSTDDFDADVAYDVTNNRYLVVYEEAYSAIDSDVYCTLLDANGGFVNGQYIDFTGDSWELPRVANNNLADQFLAVAQVSFFGADGWGPFTIRGKTIHAGTFAASAPFVISGSEFGDKYFPGVGGDPATVGPTYYCVVWERPFAANDFDIHYQLVRADTSMLFGSTQYVDNSSASYDYVPSISDSNGVPPFATQNWNVVWSREITYPDKDVHGAQIRWDGAITTPSFAIDTSPGDDWFPTPSSPHDRGSGSRDWIVASHRLIGNDDDVIVTALNGSTVLSQSNFSVMEDDAGSGTAYADQNYVSADCDGSKFLIGYWESDANRADAYIASCDLVGSALRITEGHQPLAATPMHENGPRITTNRSGGGNPGRAFAAWAQGPFGSSDIAGALYDTPQFQFFCFPGADVMPCPCGNAPSGPGHGCNNSAATGGGYLVGTGVPVADSVVLHALAMRPTTVCIFLQGNALSPSGLAFGDGVRCAGGTLKRLYTKPATTGSADAPTGGDPSIRVRSAALGDPISPGTTRWYQVFYRDPAAYACAPPGTFNTTSGIVVDWP